MSPSTTPGVSSGRRRSSPSARCSPASPGCCVSAPSPTPSAPSPSPTPTTSPTPRRTSSTSCCSAACSPPPSCPSSSSGSRTATTTPSRRCSPSRPSHSSCSPSWASSPLPLLFAVYGEPELEDAGVPLLRLFLPQMLFYGWTALGTAVLNAKRRFAVPAFAPVLNNVVVCGAPRRLRRPRGRDADLESVTDDAHRAVAARRRDDRRHRRHDPAAVAGDAAGRRPAALAVRAASTRRCDRGAPGRLDARLRRRQPDRPRRHAGRGGVDRRPRARLLRTRTRSSSSSCPHGLVAVSVMTTFVPELASAWNRGDVATVPRAVRPGSAARAGSASSPRSIVLPDRRRAARRGAARAGVVRRGRVRQHRRRARARWRSACPGSPPTCSRCGASTRRATRGRRSSSTSSRTASRWRSCSPSCRTLDDPERGLGIAYAVAYIGRRRGRPRGPAPAGRRRARRRRLGSLVVRLAVAGAVAAAAGAVCGAAHLDRRRAGVAGARRRPDRGGDRLLRRRRRAPGATRCASSSARSRADEPTDRVRGHVQGASSGGGST